ncbi:protein of unknown function [Streptococcus thermophilus]|nr:protein of unknown function [Streptococcus thermophilus]CAD0160123.1 protein of unknown function [Streptococcus thermophilus]CAD0160711.1 protein of unknown function [Streptococcus thermophilus]
MEKIITYQDIFATICLNFSKKNYCPYRESGLDDHSDLEHYIACVEEVGNPTIVAFLKANLSSLFDQN